MKNLINKKIIFRIEIYTRLSFILFMVFGYAIAFYSCNTFRMSNLNNAQKGESGQACGYAFIVNE